MTLTLTDVVGAPRAVYMGQCTRFNVRPNSVILDLLDGDTSAISPFRLSSLDMRSTFLGAQGCKALLGFVAKNNTVEVLNLTKSGLDGEGVGMVCRLVSHHPSLKHIVLDQNTISVPSARLLWEAIRNCRLGSAIELISVKGCGLDEQWESRISRALDVHRTFQKEGLIPHGRLRPVHEWRAVSVGILCDTRQRCRAIADVIIPFLQTLVNPMKLRVCPVVIAVDSSDDPFLANEDTSAPVPPAVLRGLQQCRDTANRGLPWLIVALDAEPEATLGQLTASLIPAVLSWFEHVQPQPLKDRLGRTRAGEFRTPAPASVFTINAGPSNRRAAEQHMTEDAIEALNHKDDLFGALEHTGTLHRCSNDSDFALACISWLFSALATVYDAPPLLALEVTRRQLQQQQQSVPVFDEEATSEFDERFSNVVLTGVDAVAGVLLATRPEEAKKIRRGETPAPYAILARHGLVSSQPSTRPNTACNGAPTPTPPPTASGGSRSRNRRFSTGFDPVEEGRPSSSGKPSPRGMLLPSSSDDYHSMFLSPKRISDVPITGSRPYELLEERLGDVVADWCELGRHEHSSDVRDISEYCLRECAESSFPFVLYGGTGSGKKHVLCGVAAELVENNKRHLECVIGGRCKNDPIELRRASVPIPYLVGIAPTGIAYMVDYLLFALDTVKAAGGEVGQDDGELHLDRYRPLPTDESYSSVQLLMARLSEKIAAYPASAPAVTLLISNVHDLVVPCGRPSWSSQHSTAPPGAGLNTQATPSECLKWLPAVLPPNVRVVVSVDTASRLLPELRNRFPQPFERLISNPPQIATATAIGNALRRKGLIVHGLLEVPTSATPPPTAPAQATRQRASPTVEEVPTVTSYDQEDEYVTMKAAPPSERRNTYRGQGSIPAMAVEGIAVVSDSISASHALVTKEESHCVLFPTLAVSFLEMMGAATPLNGASAAGTEANIELTSLPHHSTMNHCKWDSPESLRLLIKDAMPGTVTKLVGELLSLVEGAIAPEVSRLALADKPSTAEQPPVSSMAGSRLTQASESTTKCVDEDDLFQPYYKNRNQSVVIAPRGGRRGPTSDNSSDDYSSGINNNGTANAAEITAARQVETLRDVALCLVVRPLSAADLIAIVEGSLGNAQDTTMQVLPWLVNLGVVCLNYNAEYQLAGVQVKDGVVGFYRSGDEAPQERHQCAIASHLHEVVRAGGTAMVGAFSELIPLWLELGEHLSAAELLTDPTIIDELARRDAVASRSAVVQGLIQLLCVFENLEEMNSQIGENSDVVASSLASFQELQRASRSLSSEPPCGLHCTGFSRVVRRILRDFTSVSSSVSIMQSCLSLPEDAVLYRRARRIVDNRTAATAAVGHVPLLVPVTGRFQEKSSAHTIRLSNRMPVRHTSCDPLSNRLVCVTTSTSLTIIDSSNGGQVAHLESWTERLNTTTSELYKIEFLSAFFVPFHLATARGLSQVDRVVVLVCADRVVLWSLNFLNSSPYDRLTPECSPAGKIVGVATNFTASGSRRIMNDDGKVLVMYHIHSGHVALLDIQARKVISSFLPTPIGENFLQEESTTGATGQGLSQLREEEPAAMLQGRDIREAVFAAGNVVIVTGYDCLVYEANRIQHIPRDSDQLCIDVSVNSASRGGTDITLSRVVRGGNAPHLLAHPGSISAICVSPDGRLLATAVGSSAFVWDVSSGAQLHVCEDTGRTRGVEEGETPATADSVIRSLAFHPTGATLLVGTSEGYLVIFSMLTGAISSRMHVTRGLPPAYLDPAAIHGLSRLGCGGCVYSPDAQRIVCRFGPVLRTFDSVTYDDKGTVVAHGGSDINTIAIVPQGPIVTSGGAGEVKLFDPSRQLPTVIMALTEITPSEGVAKGGLLISKSPTLGELLSAQQPCGIIQTHFGSKEGTHRGQPDLVMVVLSARSGGKKELSAYLFERGGNADADPHQVPWSDGRRQEPLADVSSAAGVVIVSPDVLSGMDDYTLTEYILEHGLPAARRIPARRLEILVRSSAVDAVLSGEDVDVAAPNESPSSTVIIKEAVFANCCVQSRISTESFGLQNKPASRAVSTLSADAASMSRFKRQLKLRRLLDEVERTVSASTGRDVESGRSRLLAQSEKQANKIWACDSDVSSFALVTVEGNSNSIIYTIIKHSLVGMSAANGAQIFTEPLPRDIDADSDWVIAHDDVVHRIVCVGTPKLSKSTRVLVYTVSRARQSGLELVADLQGHKGPCHATVFPPRYKGDVAVTVGSDRTVRLWTLSGHAERTSYTHDCAILSAVSTGQSRLSLFDERMRTTVITLGARAQNLQVGTPHLAEIPHRACIKPYKPTIHLEPHANNAAEDNTALHITAAVAVPDSDGLILLATATSELILFDSVSNSALSQLSINGRWPISTPELSLGSLVQSITCQVVQLDNGAPPTHVVASSTRGGEILVHRLAR